MEKRLSNNTKNLLTHNTSKIHIPSTKDQSVSESTSGKNTSNIQQNNSPKQIAIPNDPDSNRLKIFTESYNPTKHKTNFMGLQIESINSPNNTKHNPPHNTIQSPNKLIGKRRNKNSTTNLPNKPKQQKMTSFGFKSSQKVHDPQKDIFTTNGKKSPRIPKK